MKQFSMSFLTSFLFIATLLMIDGNRVEAGRRLYVSRPDSYYVVPPVYYSRPVFVSPPPIVVYRPSFPVYQSINPVYQSVAPVYPYYRSTPVIVRQPYAVPTYPAYAVPVYFPHGRVKIKYRRTRHGFRVKYDFDD